MGAVARAALADSCEVTAVNPERGPTSIESEADAVVAAAEVAALVRSLPAHDGYLIACFGDPGLDAARELTAAPVVGIGEAAYTAATLVGKRFGVVTTLPRSIPALEEAIEARGLLPRLAGDPAAEHPGGRAGQPPSRHHRGDRGHLRPAGLRARRRRADPGLRRHGRRRPRGRAAGGRAGLRRRRLRRRPRPRALELRASHQQGGGLRGPEPIPYTGMQGCAVHERPRHFREYGGPEVMRWEQLADPVPDRTRWSCEVHACGLNHSDLDSRAGTSRWPFTHAVGAGRRVRRHRGGGRDGRRAASPWATRSPHSSSTPAAAAGPAAAGGPTCASGSWYSAPIAGAATRSWCRCRRGR